MKKSNMLWGIILIVLGIIFGLNALEITSINIFFKGWWTFLIIIPSFIGLFNDDDKTGNLIGLIIGVCLYLGCLNIITFELIAKLALPVVLIIVGLSILLKDTMTSKIKKKMKDINIDTDKEYYAVFQSDKLSLEKEEVNGCNLNAVFGELICDISKAKITEDIVISGTSVFGSITLLVPEDAEIKLTTTSIFGGTNNKCKNRVKDTKHTIYIKATSIFGGIDIK